MIIRGPHPTKEFTTLLNSTIEDTRLSWKARGLLAYLLSKPEDWHVHVSHLATQAPDGPSSVETGLKELKECGYLVKERHRNSDGTFDWETRIYMKPQVESTTRLSSSGLSSPGKPTPIVRTEVVSTEITNTDSVLFEQKTSRAVDVVVETELDSRFEQIWKIYPRKVGKPGARKAFAARVRDGIALADLAKAVERYVQHLKHERTESRFVMHGQTFFGPNERWRDYLPSPGAEEDVRHYDENGDEYTDSEWAAVSSGAFLKTEEAKKWRVEADDPRWLEHLAQSAKR